MVSVYSARAWGSVCSLFHAPSTPMGESASWRLKKSVESQPAVSMAGVGSPDDFIEQSVFKFPLGGVFCSETAYRSRWEPSPFCVILCYDFSNNLITLYPRGLNVHARCKWSYKHIWWRRGKTQQLLKQISQ